MKIKLTFVIETECAANAIEMDILKKFDFHNTNDVIAWHSDFDETINGKRRMFIEITYDPAIHDFNKICEYISCIEDHQSKVITHDFNTKSDEDGYHIQFNTTSRKEYEGVQQHCRSFIDDPFIMFQCSYCNKIFARKKSECVIMHSKTTTTCPNCGWVAVALK